MTHASPLMRIAVPVRGEVFCEHFGRGDGFYLCDVIEGVLDRPRLVRRPKFQCELVPHWLREMGITVVLVGGIGVVGTRRLAELGIEVVTGCAGTDPQASAEQFIHGGLGSQDNPCARFEHRHHHCRAPKPSRKGEHGAS
ncbi:MAG TPA: NifB/NifX family molybdenum-iron cluster-binding protein [Tepidisphaeraceae bacterium]|nr:NifB/NifX family molybdenum-iron cluster-binding protein [Tepidisphaeraceae bacterium]